MSDQTFIAITVAGENTGNPAPGTENIKTIVPKLGMVVPLLGCKFLT